MTNINPTLAVVTLNVNGLNTTIKRKKLVNGLFFFFKCIPGPAAPRNLSEMHVLRPYPRPLELWGWALAICFFF